MWQELTGGWPRASQGLDVMAMDPLGQGYDTQPQQLTIHQKQTLHGRTSVAWWFRWVKAKCMLTVLTTQIINTPHFFASLISLWHIHHGRWIHSVL